MTVLPIEPEPTYKERTDSFMAQLDASVGLIPVELLERTEMEIEKQKRLRKKVREFISFITP